MSKSIIYDTDAKNKILSGVRQLAKAVSVTLGPCGKNVIIDEYGSIHSTRDGVTVAKSVVLKDRFENLGANAIREVAEKSADMVGDGTTTSTVLASAIYENGLKYVTFGSNPTQIKNGIKLAAEKAIEYISSIAKPITSKNDIERVAVVSANGDKKIGSIIADAMDRIGKDGTIKVEDGKGLDLTSKIVEGMVINRSYMSPYMVTNPETMEADLENPWVLIVDGKISNFKELLPCLQAVSQTGQPLFIIAESYADEVMATLIMTSLKGGLRSVVIEAPSYGSDRRDILNDIAILCGGRVVTEATGTRLDHAVPGSGILGQARRIVSNKQNTVIIDGRGDADIVAQHTNNLRMQINSENDEATIEKLQTRLAKLTSGIGIISVGASTEAERKELRDRVDDAFCAAKAAVKKGIVPGGGVTLLAAKRELSKWSNDYICESDDERIGIKIFIDSLSEPISKILSNAGLDFATVSTKISETNNINFGYNVLTGKYVDMIEDGILDPADVVLNEIKNASSIASLLLTTDALIVDIPDDQVGKS